MALNSCNEAQHYLSIKTAEVTGITLVQCFAISHERASGLFENSFKWDFTWRPKINGAIKDMKNELTLPRG